MPSVAASRGGQVTPGGLLVFFGDPLSQKSLIDEKGRPIVKGKLGDLSCPDRCFQETEL